MIFSDLYGGEISKRETQDIMASLDGFQTWLS